MRKLSMIWMALGMAVMATACSANTTKTLTYNVATGDTIEVQLVTTDDYDITADSPFVITCGDEKMSYGTFILSDVYEEYIKIANTDEYSSMLETGEKDGNEFVFWKYENEGFSEYNFAILIGDSDTAIILANVVSEESAMECFERLMLKEK